MEQSTLMSPGQALMGMDAKDRLVEEILLLALFLVSTAANSLALLVFCRRPGLRTISNRFVINLLATNLLTTSLLAPALFGEHTTKKNASLWVEAGDSAASACSLSALLSVMLISLDQHHAVTDPLRCHTRLLQRRPSSLCAATWVAAASAAAIRATIAVFHYYYPTESALQGIQLAYYVVYLILGVIAPITIVCVMYARIYRAARSSGLRARANGASALQLHEPPPPLPNLIEEGEGEGLTLRIDGSEDVASGEHDRNKFGPFLLPPSERPVRCPSVASLRNSRTKDGKSNEDLRKGLPSVSSAPSLAAPLLAVQQRTPQTSHNGSRITSIRCRISNASLFRYREESRAARVGLLTGALAMLHVPHAAAAVASAAVPGLADCARTASLALLLLASAASPFLFALRSRRVQREARRLFVPEKSAWERASASASSAAADGQRAKAALELLRTLSPSSGEPAPDSSAESGPCRGSFSSGGSTQLSSASDE
ncbi:probable G-protein coupled receptor No9 [Bombyx mandarina]|uniref:G-protein coupled receptors family 1 profile domain-containing protein n=2 Tax=Bombyx TaxID=7090 RepID=A0A8R2R457_BOMMO|nr:probable G-protein coupled receptor No9 [Bombyx mandarina]XP_037872221.1 probable G-protein coupled receptor No9 [Bombyx mori]